MRLSNTNLWESRRTDQGDWDGENSEEEGNLGVRPAGKHINKLLLRRVRSSHCGAVG